MANFDAGSFSRGLLAGAAVVDTAKYRRQQIAQQQLENARRDRMEQNMLDRQGIADERYNKAEELALQDRARQDFGNTVNAARSAMGSDWDAKMDPVALAQVANETLTQAGHLQGDHKVTNIRRADDGTMIALISGTGKDGKPFTDKPMSVTGGTDDAPIVFKPGELARMAEVQASRFNPDLRKAVEDARDLEGDVDFLYSTTQQRSNSATQPRGLSAAAGGAPSGSVAQSPSGQNVVNVGPVTDPAAAPVPEAAPPAAEAAPPEATRPGLGPDEAIYPGVNRDPFVPPPPEKRSLIDQVGDYATGQAKKAGNYLLDQAKGVAEAVPNEPSNFSTPEKAGMRVRDAVGAVAAGSSLPVRTVLGAVGELAQTYGRFLGSFLGMDPKGDVTAEDVTAAVRNPDRKPTHDPGNESQAKADSKVIAKSRETMVPSKDPAVAPAPAEFRPTKEQLRAAVRARDRNTITDAQFETWMQTGKLNTAKMMQLDPTKELWTQNPDGSPGVLVRPAKADSTAAYKAWQAALKSSDAQVKLARKEFYDQLSNYAKENKLDELEAGGQIFSAMTAHAAEFARAGIDVRGDNFWKLPANERAIATYAITQYVRDHDAWNDRTVSKMWADKPRDDLGAYISDAASNYGALETEGYRLDDARAYLRAQGDPRADSLSDTELTQLIQQAAQGQ